MGLCRYILIKIIIIVIIRPIIITINKSVNYFMRRNYGHKTLHLNFTSTGKKNIPISRITKSYKIMKKISQKYAGNRTITIINVKNLPTVGGGTPPSLAPLARAWPLHSLDLHPPLRNSWIRS